MFIESSLKNRLLFDKYIYADASGVFTGMAGSEIITALSLETTGNKSESITELNEESTTEYPSNQAVTSYIKTKLQNIGSVDFTTTEPTADNSLGKLTIALLDTEPAVRYNGYLYFITE
jgi:hypothetical protein